MLKHRTVSIEIPWFNRHFQASLSLQIQYRAIYLADFFLDLFSVHILLTHLFFSKKDNDCYGLYSLYIDSASTTTFLVRFLKGPLFVFAIVLVVFFFGIDSFFLVSTILDFQPTLLEFSFGVSFGSGGRSKVAAVEAVWFEAWPA